MKSPRFALASVAVACLALTGFARTARAEYTGASSDDSFGGGDVSAGYSASAGLTYCNATDLANAKTNLVCVIKNPLTDQCVLKIPKDFRCYVGATQTYASASASGSGWVDLFDDKESVSVRASAITSDGQSSMNFNVTAFGSTLINESQANIPVGVGASFGASKSYSIVGISVKVKGEVGAWIGAYLGGGAIADGFQLNVTPTITAGVDASASVGALCASAGIDGDIDALDLQVPSKLKIAYTGGQLTYGIGADFDYSLLSGKLKVKACACGACDSTTIASYGGWSGSFPIFNASSSMSL